MNTQAVIDYLKTGGLITILQKQNVQAVWLYTREDGSVRHTFTQPDHGVGGQPIPRSASTDGKVFCAVPNKERVVEFLKGIGLSGTEADEVIKAAGTAP